MHINNQAKPRLVYMLMLLSAAFIFGFSFVVMQRASDHLSAFAFNGLTWMLGSLVVFPLVRRKSLQPGGAPIKRKYALIPYLIIGFTMFSGMTLLQMGVQHTTAGKAGFITGLYVVIVPVFDFILFRRSRVFTWVSVIVATTGLYLLFSDPIGGMNRGDLLILGGAFCWSAHFHILSWAGDRIDSARTMLAQCLVVGGMSMLLALLRNELDLNAIVSCRWEILYSGLIFVGLGSLMEVHGIRNLPPSMSAVILSLESVFALLAGWLVLGETMSSRAMAGCALMFSAIFIIQQKGAESRARIRSVSSPEPGGQPRPA